MSQINRLPWWLSRRRGLDTWVGKISWRSPWQPTPVFLPGESHILKSLVGCTSWGRKESNMTEQLSKHACRKTGLSVLTPDSPRNPHSGAHCPWLAGMATFLPLQMHCCVPLVPEWVLFCCLLRVPFILLGRPGGSVSEESHCSTGDPGSITGSGRSPGEGNGKPLRYPCLENPLDRGSWWLQSLACKESDTTEWFHSVYFALWWGGQVRGLVPRR